jgi:molybdopterin/thiamine biosynthesis adenylyltransferase
MQKVIVKIPRQIFVQAKADLLRPHPHAAERVGFFSTRCTVTKDIRLVHCVSYHSVEDVDYLEDQNVGACIGSKAITNAMARSVNDSVGQLHVHWHGDRRLPRPSEVDWRGLPPLAKSLRNANAKEVHGWLILGQTDAWTSLLIPGATDPVNESICSIVGFPTARNRPALPPRLPTDLLSKEDRYHRQSFLGSDSDAIIAGTKVAVIGLGGGGSHIVQQLAHLGFRSFVLFDDDRIAQTNLNRLIGGTLSDVHKKTLKVDIAARIIRSLHRKPIIEKHAAKWATCRGALLDCDVVFGCVDQLIPRRELEAFCRRNLIPYIDVGMDVEKTEAAHEIYGQVILSMPGHACMQCSGFLNLEKMAREAAKYGDAGSNPQVVWSNGIVCSSAVGVGVDLLTDWSQATHNTVFLNMIGSRGTLMPDRRLEILTKLTCSHYPLQHAGDPILKRL